MNPLRLFVIAFILMCITLPQLTFAQDNIRVTYSNASTTPDFLNVCGDTDEVTITVGVNGTSTSTREGIVTTANLFEGITFAGLNAAATSAGVTLVDGSDPSNPVFSIPDLSPLGVTSADLTFSIQADCNILDTLNSNNALNVFDEWETTYTLDGTAESEIDATSDYRDALAVPFFTLLPNTNAGPFRVGDCFDREITVSNSGLAGFVDTLEYTVTQGPGASISSILVNGLPAPISKTLDMNGDTVITLSIGADEFALNTVGGGPGDGNAFIDPNETVTITETICVSNCEDSRVSNHEAGWGCFGRICSTVDMPDFVRVGDGAANPEVLTSGVNPTVNVGYCQEGAAAVTYTNNGVELDAGFGTMLDIQLGIGLGTTFLVSDNGYTITSYNIGGVDIPVSGSIIDLGNNPAFTTDPDGPGGLVDFDGDGFFDDLELTESVELAINYEVDCAQGQGTDDNCINDFSSFLSSRVTYSDACGEGITVSNNGFVRPSNVNSDIEDFASPDAFAMGDVFFVTHTESRSVRLFEKNCGGDEVFRATIVLPPGVSNVAAQTTLIKNESTIPIPMLSNSVSNDTLTLIFDASTDAFINGNYELNMAFQADCNAVVGQSSFPTTFEFVCPPCNCEHLWYCADIVGPFIHKDVPPCPPDPAVICPVGIKSTGFDVYRTTYGFTDASYTTKIDPANANRKVAVSCDSVEMVVSGVVGETAHNGSIGFNIDYTNPDGTTDAGDVFLFDDGMVRINQGGTDFFCPVTMADVDTSSVGGNKNIRVELPNCLSDLGLTLNPGDSLEFIGNFAVNPDGPFEVQFTKVPNFRAHPFAVVAGVDEFCETYGDIFTIAATSTLFAAPSSNDFPVGCEETFLNYQLISIFNDFPAFYGNEFYPSNKVDSLKFTFDTEILNAFDVVDVEVSIPGHPTFGDDFFAVPPLSSAPGGDYVAYFDTLNLVPALNDLSGFSFNFRVRLIPNCGSLIGSSNGDNTFNFDPEIFYQSNYYAQLVSDASCVNSVVEQKNDIDITYTDPPTFLLNNTNSSAANFILEGDTATWDIRLCNNSIEADAGITWLALDNVAGDIVVEEITDISDPANPQVLTFNSYGTTGTNVFAFSDGLLRAVGTTAPEDLCNTYRIKATVTACGELDLMARTGWACQPIVDPTWSPEDYPPCNALEFPLSITTRDPFLDADVEVQPQTDLELCEVNSVTIRLKNTDFGAAFDLTSRLVLPVGATLVPGSVEFAYPADTPLVPVATDPTLVSTTAMGITYEYADFSALNASLDTDGLPGDDLDPATEDSELLIKFDFKTDCDFTSGSSIFFNFQALRGCNGPSNLEAGETVPVRLNGDLSGALKLFDINITGGTALVPEEQSELEITVVNQTNTPSNGAGDLVQITLPDGIVYVPNTTVSVQPAGYIPGEPAIESVGTQQILTWPLANGMLLNESAVLRLSVTTPILDCDVMSLDGRLVILTGQDFVCIDDGSVCMSNTISSTNGGQLVQFPVRQGVLTFDISTITSTCVTATTEEVTVTGNIVNGNMDFPAVPFDVEYYNDVDGNGSIDGTDVLLGTFTENGPLAANASIPFSHTFEAGVSEVCNLILRSDVSAVTMNNCGETVFTLSEPRLLNAGPDQVICQDAASSILTLGDANCDVSSYGYSWSAVAPATTANLSATDIPTPTFTINMADVTELQYAYVLLTTRPGCSPTRDTAIFTVQAPPTVIAMADTPIACPGSPVALTATGGDVYEWFEGMNSIGVGASITVTPLNSTTYTVNAIDVNGCQNSATVDITLDPSVCPCDLAQVTSVINNASNCGESVGSATINIDLNPADYDFVWTPDLGTAQGDGETRTDLIFGGYLVDIVSLADANCSTETFALIQNADGPQATVFTTPATCSAPDGTATLSPPSFNYTWSNDASNASARTDLESGVYFVTFSDPASADPTCENVIAVVIGEDNPLEADATIVDQPDCGVANGEVNITVTGGSGVYTFTWFDAFEGPTRNDLAAGIYVVTIVDQDITMCELPFIFIITDDVPQGTVDITAVNDISCFGLTDGGIDYTVSYDPLFTNPADTLFSNGTTTFTNGALPAGSYCIQINDGNGCVAGGDCFTIIEPDPLTLNISSTSDCNDNGTLSVTGVGGTPPYSYDWADLPGSNNSSFRQNLGAGLFNIQVNDANDCSNSISGIEVQACSCESVDVSSVQILEATCGEADGFARVGLNGDPANFTYAWTPDVGVSGAFDNERSDLEAGAYTVVIAASGGGPCVDSVNFVVTSIGGLEAMFTSTPASCAAADGTASLIPNTFSYTWPDGMITDTRSDLATGSYIVTVTDGPDDCPGLIEVTVATANPLLGDVTVTTQPDCGESNGEVTINPTGVAGPFEFLWADGNTNATRDDLSSGLYVVTITDMSGAGCELPFLFILTDDVPPGTVTINSVDSVSCSGQSDGGVNFDVAYDPAFDAPADTIISDGFFVYENGNLPIGNYCISILDANGCVAGGECFEVIEPVDISLFIIITEDCSSGGSATVRVSGGTAPYTFDWSDVPGTDDDMNRVGLLADTITLVVTDVNGCMAREDEVVIPECSSVDCDFFNGLDSLAQDALSCDGLQELCFEEILLADLQNFEIFVDDSLYTDIRDECNAPIRESYPFTGSMDPGPFELTAWEYNDSIYTTTFGALPDLINYMNSIDTNSEWTPLSGPTGNILGIIGGNPDNMYGVLSFVSMSTGVIFNNNTNLTSVPLGSFILIDTGFHEVVFVDPIQMCSDTLTVFMDPANLLCDIVFDTIMPLDTVVFCIDTTGVGFTGPITSVEDICEDSNGTNVSFMVDSVTLCVEYAGITLGIDTACIVLCDMNGVCDTTNFVVTVVSEPEIVRDTIFPGDMEIFCLDVSIFEGVDYTIDNFCPGSADGDVDFLIDPVSNCIEYFGNQTGIDSACIQICDELGFCDTTFFYIVVDSIGGPPIAMNDIDTTVINTPTVIDFKGNDQIFGVLDTVFLITDPIYGEASINLDCSLTYDPDNDFCDVTDNFDYVICNEMGCDTATISIFIDCEGEIVIFTAVSPNGDGVNDFFHVGGIDAFPNNRLCIFNRWGNQVLLKEGYNNDFDGRWENRDLPDGTYFYILELNDQDNRVFKGFFEMYR